MTEIRNKLSAIMGLVLFVAMPEVVLSGNSAAGFVPPVLMNPDTAGKVHNDHLEHWQKYQWRGGSGFNMPERFKFVKNFSSALDSQVYTLTEPQRKSVNPWKINSFNNSRYTSRAVRRPWGRVPDQFNRKAVPGNYPDQYSIATDRVYRNSVQHRPFIEPEPMFRPYRSSHLLNNSNLLSPFTGYFPINPGSMLINAPPVYYQRYASPGNYIW